MLECSRTRPDRDSAARGHAALEQRPCPGQAAGRSGFGSRSGRVRVDVELRAMSAFAEPLFLGFSSGLVCLASCGPVLLPWLAAAGSGWRGTTSLLALFLSGRLLGYLGFATVAWALGLALPSPAGGGGFVFAAVHLALAAALLLYAFPPRPRRDTSCPDREAISRRRGLALRFGALGPAALGLLTGLNVCPPFVAAGVRAAEARSLPAALGFFLLFFAGTALWFLPFLGVAAVRRFPHIGLVARLTTAIVAVYYAYLGTVTLAGALLHVWHDRA